MQILIIIEQNLNSLLSSLSFAVENLRNTGVARVLLWIAGNQEE